MLIPISDDDRALSRPAYVTIVLFAANVIVFLFQQGLPGITDGYAAVPLEITEGKDLVETVHVKVGAWDFEEPLAVPQAPGPNPLWLTLFTSMFLHAGWLHLGGNMLFLWIFGDNVEHRFGHLWFLLFYLVSGVIGALAHIFTDPDSVIPMVGASGAIAGVMGAYLMLFPRNRVNAIIFLFWFITLPAWAVIGLWAIVQIVSGFNDLTSPWKSDVGGVAYLAHVGGLVAGVLLGGLCRLAMHGKEPDSVLLHQYQSDDRAKRWW